MDIDATPLLPGTPVLLTGATGFTGSLLARKLVGMGVALRVIARPSSDRSALQNLNIQWFTGEVFDPQTAARAAAGVDYVFHVAAAYRAAGLPDETYRKVHVTSTQLLAAAVRQNPAFQRFVHLSTVGVHGHVANPPANEESPFNPGDIYQQTKAEAELWLRDFAAQSRLPFTVIRPAAIYGPGDRRLLKIFRMASKPFFPLLGRSQGLYHLVHVEDLTDAILRAATHPAAQGEVFIIGDPAAVTLEYIGRTIAAEYGRPLRVVRLPAWPFFLAAMLCETACRPLKIEPPLYRRRVAFFTKDRSFDTRKLRARLGFQGHYPAAQGLRATARWYVEKGWVRL